MLSRVTNTELTVESLKGFSLEEDIGLAWVNLPAPEEVLEWFRFLGAGWVHSGDLAKPHARLASGKHSTGYFLCKKVLKFGNLREILAACIIRELERANMMPNLVDGVFGAPYSSITLAADVGRLLGVPNYIVEKGPKDECGKDTMVFKADDPIPEGAILLQVEELITTTLSAGMAAEAIVHSNPNKVRFAPFIGALIYRPQKFGNEFCDGKRLVPFIKKEVEAWDAADCPLCRAGSEAIAPKNENWAKFTA